MGSSTFSQANNKNSVLYPPHSIKKPLQKTQKKTNGYLLAIINKIPVRQYNLIIKNPQKHLKNYQWRHALLQPVFLILFIEIQCDFKKYLAQNHLNLNIYTEHMIQSLNNMQCFNLPQAIYALQQAFSGYEAIYKRYGYVSVGPYLMGMNTQGIFKVWINTDLYENIPSQLKIYDQSAIISKIMEVINNFSAKQCKYLFVALKKWCQKQNQLQNQLNFINTKQFLNNYIVNCYLSVPKSLIHRVKTDIIYQSFQNSQLSRSNKFQKSTPHRKSKIKGTTSIEKIQYIQSSHFLRSPKSAKFSYQSSSLHISPKSKVSARTNWLVPHKQNTKADYFGYNIEDFNIIQQSDKKIIKKEKRCVPETIREAKEQEDQYLPKEFNINDNRGKCYSSAQNVQFFSFSNKQKSLSGSRQQKIQNKKRSFAPTQCKSSFNQMDCDNSRHRSFSMVKGSNLSQDFKEIFDNNKNYLQHEKQQAKINQEYTKENRHKRPNSIYNTKLILQSQKPIQKFKKSVNNVKEQEHIQQRQKLQIIDNNSWKWNIQQLLGNSTENCTLNISINDGNDQNFLRNDLKLDKLDRMGRPLAQSVTYDS